MAPGWFCHIEWFCHFFTPWTNFFVLSSIKIDLLRTLQWALYGTTLWHQCVCWLMTRGVIIGSAEALPKFLREWLLWVLERERETPVTSLITRWNREWSCIWLPRRRVDPTRRHVLSLSSARSACKDKELGAWALKRAAESSDWWMKMGKWKLCDRWSAAVDHPAAFRWHASSKKNRPSWRLFPFRLALVLPLRTSWISDIR